MEQSIIVGLFTFCIGLILGHRLALGRDLRKEFNETTNETYFELIRSIKNDSTGGIKIDCIRIEHYMPWYSRRSFRKCVERYQSSIQGHGASTYHVETGTVSVDEVAKAKILKYAVDISNYLKPR